MFLYTDIPKQYILMDRSFTTQRQRPNKKTLIQHNSDILTWKTKMQAILIFKTKKKPNLKALSNDIFHSDCKPAARSESEEESCHGIPVNHAFSPRDHDNHTWVLTSRELKPRLW